MNIGFNGEVVCLQINNGIGKRKKGEPFHFEFNMQTAPGNRIKEVLVHAVAEDLKNLTIGHSTNLSQYLPVILSNILDFLKTELEVPNHSGDFTTGLRKTLVFSFLDELKSLKKDNKEDARISGIHWALFHSEIGRFIFSDINLDLVEILRYTISANQLDALFFAMFYTNKLERLSDSLCNCFSKNGSDPLIDELKKYRDGLGALPIGNLDPVQREIYNVLDKIYYLAL